MNDKVKLLKLCPDLKQQEEYKAILIGSGDKVITYFHKCIEENCAAYKNGYCEKFKNKVLVDVDTNSKLAKKSHKR